MAVGYNPRIVTDGLILALDAANTKSYPSSGGSTWYDLSGKGNNGTITNATFNSDGYFAFEGSGDYISFASASELQFLNRLPYTLEVWMYPTSNPGANTWTGILIEKIVVLEVVMDIISTSMDLPVTHSILPQKDFVLELSQE